MHLYIGVFNFPTHNTYSKWLSAKTRRKQRAMVEWMFSDRESSRQSGYVEVQGKAAFDVIWLVSRMNCNPKNKCINLSYSEVR